MGRGIEAQSVGELDLEESKKILPCLYRYISIYTYIQSLRRQSLTRHSPPCKANTPLNLALIAPFDFFIAPLCEERHIYSIALDRIAKD